MRATPLLATSLALFAAAAVWAGRSSAQVLPCDATCVGGIDPLECTSYVSYVCSTCLLYRWCRGFGVPGTQLCWDFAKEGTKITHTICPDGTHRDEWSGAPCGSCYG